MLKNVLRLSGMTSDDLDQDGDMKNELKKEYTEEVHAPYFYLLLTV